MNRKLKTDLYNILDLIACSNDYGHNGQIIMGALLDMTGDLSSDDIESFAKYKFLSEHAQEQGYGVADYESAIETIAFYAKKHDRLK